MKLAADFTEVWTAPRNRRRYATGLVAVWAVFWLVLAGQPYCEALAATPGHEKSQSTSDASYLTIQAYPDGHGADSRPDYPEVSCVDSVGIDSVAIDSTAAKTDRPTVTSLAPGDGTPTPTRDPRPLHHELYGTPPPVIALYLRNLHLLIYLRNLPLLI